MQALQSLVTIRMLVTIRSDASESGLWKAIDSASSLPIGPLTAAKKQSNCPGAAKTLQSPKEPMQKDHREKLWDYTREKDVQPSSTRLSFLLLQLESSECMRDLEPELPRQACLNSYLTETADKKIISIVLSHVVWGVICYSWEIAEIYLVLGIWQFLIPLPELLDLC